jgi:hypothetical protein
MNLNELLDIEAKDLKKAKFEAIKTHIIKTLHQVQLAVEVDEYDELLSDMCNKVPTDPIVDGDVTFIEFGFGNQYPMDIADIIKLLQEYK